MFVWRGMNPDLARSAQIVQGRQSQALSNANRSLCSSERIVNAIACIAKCNCLLTNRRRAGQQSALKQGILQRGEQMNSSSIEESRRRLSCRVQLHFNCLRTQLCHRHKATHQVQILVCLGRTYPQRPPGNVYALLMIQRLATLFAKSKGFTRNPLYSEISSAGL